MVPTVTQGCASEATASQTEGAYQFLAPILFRLLVLSTVKSRRRQPTQRRVNWPFLYSVVAGRGLVLNLPPKARRQAKKARKRKDEE